VSRALILGGSGFVGSRLVQALLREGAEVCLLNRGVTADQFGDRVERLVADRTNRVALQAALSARTWDAVYDVSGFVMAAGGADIDDLLNLLDGATQRYVYVSSIMAYDQSLVGVFPWTEDMPTNADSASGYGGFKGAAERAILKRFAATGFPATIVRPAAIYGPENNIFDMELPMFLRLLQNRPILMPHGGLVVGSYGHVDDLCAAMIEMANHPAAVGEVFNITANSCDTATYVATLARVVGAEPVIVPVPDDRVDDFTPPVFGHLFKRRHHAMLSTEKAFRLLGVVPSFDLYSGHMHTYEWFRAQGFDALTDARSDPLWKVSWDFAAEAEAAALLRALPTTRSGSDCG
jgi:nucleoside-diphosphate-sugar epimerase